MPEDMEVDAPTGCLGCNPEPVRAFLLKAGIAPDRFKEVPPPRHAWGDVVTCSACGRAWLKPPPPAEHISLTVEVLPPPDHARGLYEKFRVERRDGSSGPGGKHERCEYYVLDLVHDKHALPALIAYAACCEEEFPKLAEDLRQKVAKIHAEREARKEAP